MTGVARYFCVLILVALFSINGNAQHTIGRCLIGVDARANSWFNDYNRRIVGLGGSLSFRYGVSRRFSAGIEITRERLKAEQDPLTLEAPFDYLRLDGTSFSLVGWWHILPGRPVAPYAFAGIGFFQYKRSTGVWHYIPDGKTRTSIRIPLGIGIESFIQRGVSFDFNAGYVLLNDATDMIKRGLPDGSVNVKFGVNFYFGSSDDEDADADGLTSEQEERAGTNSTNPDSDEDGLNDGEEVRRYKTDPLNADSDFDGLKDGEEVLKYKTDPLHPDTDGDGYKDGLEVIQGTDPLKPSSHPIGQE
jgi:hypothetical protein